MFRKLSLLAVLAIAVISCQKEFTVEDTDPPPVNPVNDSTLLKTYIERDTTLTGHDTVSSHSYTYDAQKRMTTTISRFEFDHTTGTPGISYVLKFSYNGSDTLPYRISSVSNNFDGLDFYSYLDTVYFTYNASGQRVKDSIRSSAADNSESSVEVNQYTYSPGKIIVKGRVQYLTGSSAPDIFETLDTLHVNLLNGNILSQVDTAYDDLGEYTVSNLSFMYDTKSNPFLLAQKMLNLSQVLHLEMNGWELMQKNNPLQISNKMRYYDGTEDGFGRKFTYTYHANNFPASVIVKNYDPFTGTETFLSKGIFSYTP